MKTNSVHQLKLPLTTNSHELAAKTVVGFQWELPFLPSSAIKYQPHRKAPFKGFPLNVLHCIKGSVLWSHWQVITETLSRVLDVCLALFRNEILNAAKISLLLLPQIRPLVKLIEIMMNHTNPENPELPWCQLWDTSGIMTTLSFQWTDLTQKPCHNAQRLGLKIFLIFMHGDFHVWEFFTFVYIKVIILVYNAWSDMTPASLYND